jgi:elongation factor 1-alpha
MKMAKKPHLNLVFIGHVDHGKSTTVGRVLLETGHIEKHIIEKFRKEAEEKGKATFEFAWVMDHLKEERERGLTIDVAHRRFDTQKYYFTIIDAPGHRDFVKNMITGTSQADAAVLVVSVPEGVMAQTKEHIFLARTLGVEQLIVAMNKMDATIPPYDENKYNEVKTQVENLLKSVGFKTDDVPFIPLSAFKGDNINAASENMSWYKGATLVATLDTITEPSKPTDKALRLPVQDVYTIKGIGTVPVGRIETGVLKPNTKITFQPSDKVGEVKSIEMHHENVDEAIPGDNVGFNVRGVERTDIRRGDVAGPTDNPPAVAKTFTARIMVLNHPSVITAGYTPVFHCHTSQVARRGQGREAGIPEDRGCGSRQGETYKAHGDREDTGLPAARKVRDQGHGTVAAGMCIEIEKR